MWFWFDLIFLFLQHQALENQNKVYLLFFFLKKVTKSEIKSKKRLRFEKLLVKSNRNYLLLLLLLPAEWYGSDIFFSNILLNNIYSYSTNGGSLNQFNWMVAELMTILKCRYDQICLEKTEF